MTLLDQLKERGVTAEDLEKAAAVRLFEKAASAEGIDLDALPAEQVSILFEQFASNTHSTKEASAMNNDVIDLFEKTAADEGLDLEALSQDDLEELFQHYVDNVLPEQLAALEDGGEDGTDDEKVASAHEKLAEAEILGRHMARAYMDELAKEASARVNLPKPLPKGKDLKALMDKVPVSYGRGSAFRDTASGAGKGEGMLARLGRGIGESSVGRRLGYGQALSDRQMAAGGSASQSVLDKALSKAEKAAKKGKGSRLTDSELSSLRRSTIRNTDTSKATGSAQADAARKFNRMIGGGALAAGAVPVAAGAAYGVNSMRNKSASAEDIQELAEELASDIIAELLLAAEE